MLYSIIFESRCLVDVPIGATGEVCEAGLSTSFVCDPNDNSDPGDEIGVNGDGHSALSNSFSSFLVEPDFGGQSAVPIADGFVDPVGISIDKRPPTVHPDVNLLRRCCADSGAPINKMASHNQ